MDVNFFSITHVQIYSEYDTTLLLFCWCDMRKINSVKYPFPRNWTPFAHTFDVGDKKSATACWKYRTFSDKEGFGLTIYIMRECPEDNFVWVLPSIGKPEWRPVFRPPSWRPENRPPESLQQDSYPFQLVRGLARFV